MSTLSDRDILYALQCKEIQIEPYDRARLQPASYDITLGEGFQVPLGTAYNELVSIDRSKKAFPRMRQSSDAKFGGDSSTRHVLNPGQFVIGTSLERVRLGRRMVCRVEGKSTLGRMGLVVHCTAGYVDPGFEGQITLELFNCAPYPIELVAGCPIGQLRFERLSSPCSRPYGAPGLGSHYQGQDGATPAKL
jgi:dCTP deaminase